MIQDASSPLPTSVCGAVSITWRCLVESLYTCTGAASELAARSPRRLTCGVSCVDMAAAPTHADCGSGHHGICRACQGLGLGRGKRARRWRAPATTVAPRRPSGRRFVHGRLHHLRLSGSSARWGSALRDHCPAPLGVGNETHPPPHGRRHMRQPGYAGRRHAQVPIPPAYLSTQQLCRHEPAAWSRLLLASTLRRRVPSACTHATSEISRGTLEGLGHLISSTPCPSEVERYEDRRRWSRLALHL